MLSPEQPDWHGDKAKRKRGSTSRRTMLFLFVLGFGMAAVLLASGVVLIVIINGRINRDTYQSTVMSSLTGDMTLKPTVDNTERLFEYGFVVRPDESAIMVFLQEWETQALPNYHFQNLRYSFDGNLYAAHARMGNDYTCDSKREDAYWIINSQGRKIDQIADSSLVNPTRIVFDGDGNSYVAATNCKTQQQALFKFNIDHQLVDTWDVKALKIADLVATRTGRIFISLNGFDATVTMPAHLLELASNSAGKLNLVAKFGTIEFNEEYSAMLLTPEQDAIYMLWKDAQGTERLQMLDVRGTSPVFGNAVIHSDYLTHLPLNKHITDLAWQSDGTLLAFSDTTNEMLYFSSMSNQHIVKAYDVPRGKSHTFTVNPANQHVVFAGTYDGPQ